MPPKLNEDEREQRRLAKNELQRQRRLSIKQARETAKARLARAGVKNGSLAIGGQAGGFAPSPEDRLRVEMLAGLGLRHDEIAIMVVNPATGLPVNEKTLRLHFERELAQGVVKANSKVAESLYNQATGTGGTPRSTTAAIFWLKARAGWRETQHVEVEVRSGVLVAPAGVSPEDWVRAAQAENVTKVEPGKKLLEAAR